MTIEEPIYLRKLYIKDFKGIEELELEFPEPRMANDPDIFVLGSKNGVGKTSILEACFLLYLGIFGLKRQTELDSNVRKLLIRAGCEEAYLEGEYAVGDRTSSIKMKVTDKLEIKVDDVFFQKHFVFYFGDHPITSYLSGLDPNPVTYPHFMYFPSNRKVQEGNLDLGKVLGTTDESDRVSSTFKQKVLLSLLGKAGLIEDLDEEGAEEELEVLNTLVREFAGGLLEKLRPAKGSSLEIRVTPIEGGASFSFDGLSSGQKEMIATLFLIWKNTKDRPGLVLIDEPELHLNAEWHRKFIRHLHKLAPQNQYILATHSEDVFASVDKDRRLMISKK